MKRYILSKQLWIRSNQWHSHLWDELDSDEPYYPMRAEGNWIRKKGAYRFKEWRHRHLSNMR